MSAASGAGGNDAFREDAAAYVLGALTAEDHERFTIHLGGCPECRAEVDRLQVVADALPLAAPQLSAPAGLKQRVMSAVATETAGSDVERAEAPDTAEPAPTLGRGGAARVPRAARRSPRRWAIGVAGGLAAAAVVLAVIALATSGGGAGARMVRAEVLPRGASAWLRIDEGRAELLVNGMPRFPHSGPTRYGCREADRHSRPTRCSASAARAGRPSRCPGASPGRAPCWSRPSRSEAAARRPRRR